MMALHEPEREHLPVLPAEVCRLLKLKPGGRYLDGTLGAGGHAESILASHATIELLGIDRDEAALALARQRLSPYARRARLLHGTFAHLAELAASIGWKEVDGILLDVGVSSMQIDDASRGFSYRLDGPLDMRMDRRGPVTASTIVNTADEAELRRLLREYGEEPRARQLAQAIVKRRTQRPFERTGELAEFVRQTLGASRRSLPPEARCFQALRIAVNGELDQLAAGLDQAHGLLAPGGRLVVISFHSLEDRLVKQRFRYWATTCVCPPGLPICRCDKVATVEVVTRKPVTATDAEIAHNRRAASAKLRCAEKRPITQLPTGG